MASFKTAFEKTLHWETGGDLKGAYHKHPDDPGGSTKWGVSQAAFPELDIKHLTLSDASIIYQREYWLPLRAYELDNQDLANALYDYAVNSGVGRAVKGLQLVLGFSPKHRDGIMGPMTITAANRSRQLSQKLNIQRLNYLKLLPHWKTFRNGWSRRIDSF